MAANRAFALYHRSRPGARSPGRPGTHDPFRGASHSRSPGCASYSQLVCPGARGPHPGQGPPAAAGRYQAHPWQTGRPDMSGQAQRTSSSGQSRANLKPGPSSRTSGQARARSEQLRASPSSGRAQARGRAVLGPRPGLGPGPSVPQGPDMELATFGHRTLAKLSSFVLRH